MEPVLEALATPGTTTLDATTARRVELLCADFLACVASSPREHGAGPFRDDDLSGTAVGLALSANARDLDDVDWTSLHHPGSVIWSALAALAMRADLSGTVTRLAAVHGYRTAATVADILGSGHRSRWHITATAGALGAASAASVALGYSPDLHARALGLAATSAGGLGRAAGSRTGAAAFTRAAAASLGLVAARAAATSVPVLDAPLTGPGGLLAVTTVSDSAAPGGEPAAPPSLREGVLDAAPRLYPASGFLQAAIAAVARARLELGGDLRQLRVGLSPGVIPLVSDGHGGAWWDAGTCLLRAWAAGNPFAADLGSPLDARTDLVLLEAMDIAPGHAYVTVVSDAGTQVLDVAPPSWEDPGIDVALDTKWQLVLGADAVSTRERAHAVLTDSGSSSDRRAGWTA